jgi:hypothetical protein
MASTSGVRWIATRRGLHRRFRTIQVQPKDWPTRL